MQLERATLFRVVHYMDDFLIVVERTLAVDTLRRSL